jgi:hypothetical protein
MLLINTFAEIQQEMKTTTSFFLGSDAAPIQPWRE